MRNTCWPLAAFLLGGLAAAPASAATFKARVEAGNNVIVTGRSKGHETCSAMVMFTYSDPKEPGKRFDGKQMCPNRDLSPGKDVLMCRNDYPVEEIKIAGQVQSTCVPTAAK